MAVKLYDETPDRASNLYKKASRSAALGKESQLGKGIKTGDVYTTKLNASEGPQLVVNPSELTASDLGLSKHEFNQLSRKDRRELAKLAVAAGLGADAEVSSSGTLGGPGETVRRVSDLVEAGRGISTTSAVKGATTVAKRGVTAKVAQANKIARRASMASGATVFSASDMDADADTAQEVGDKAMAAGEKAVAKATAASKRRAEKRAAMLARDAAEAAATGAAGAAGSAEAAGAAAAGSASAPAVAERAAEMAAKADELARAAARMASRTKVSAARAGAKTAAKAQAGVKKGVARIFQRRRAVTAQALASGGRAAAAANMGGSKAAAATLGRGAAAKAGGGGAAAAATFLAPAALLLIMLVLFVALFGGGFSAFGAGGSGIASAAETEYALYNKETGDGTYMEGGKKYNGDGVSAWCAFFASYCIREAGVEEALGLESGKLQNGWHDYWLTVFGTGKSNKYLTIHVNDGKYTPQRGDLAIRCDSSCPTNAPAGCIADAKDPAHEGQHVAIVVAANSPSSYVTIEGNNGNLLNCVGYNWATGTYESAAGSEYRISNPNGYNSYDYFVTLNAGGSGNIPEPYGTSMTYEKYNINWAAGTRQQKLHSAWEQKGAKFDKQGFARLNGYYLVACTTKYGKVGDKIDFKLTDGQVIHCIMADEKSLADPGCNEWGHDEGRSVIEFCVDKYKWYSASSGYTEGSHANPGSSSCKREWKGLRVCNWKNLGSAGYI